MEPLTIETFNPDIIKAIDLEWKNVGDINYTSVKIEYNGGKTPPLGSMENSDYLDSRISKEISTRYP